MRKPEIISPSTILRSVTVHHKTDSGFPMVTTFKNVRMVYRGNRRNGVTIMHRANEKAVARFSFVNQLSYTY